jgi:NADP-dependent 3-hydroxy acid dehydrogenase YdfG
VIRLLEDKVVVVSGIGPGLGVHLATQAAEAGARLVIAARTAEKLDSAERDIAALAPGTDVLKVPTDILGAVGRRVLRARAQDGARASRRRRPRSRR